MKYKFQINIQGRKVVARKKRKASQQRLKGRIGSSLKLKNM